jgi:hypothetical protein
MRMPRLRIWMLVVFIALVAVMLGARAAHRRREAELHALQVRFQGLANFHRTQTNVVCGCSVSGEGVEWGDLTACYDSSGAGVPNKVLEWHGFLAEKYARAAERPWLPVAPDPPWPK